LVDHTLDIAENVIVPKTDHAKTETLQYFCPPHIGRIVLMLTAVQFNDDFQFSAAKVSDKITNGHLALELQSVNLTITDLRPKQPFRVGP